MDNYYQPPKTPFDIISTAKPPYSVYQRNLGKQSVGISYDQNPTIQNPIVIEKYDKYNLNEEFNRFNGSQEQYDEPQQMPSAFPEQSNNNSKFDLEFKGTRSVYSKKFNGPSDNFQKYMSSNNNQNESQQLQNPFSSIKKNQIPPPQQSIELPPHSLKTSLPPSLRTNYQQYEATQEQQNEYPQEHKQSINQYQSEKLDTFQSPSSKNFMQLHDQYQSNHLIESPQQQIQPNYQVVPLVQSIPVEQTTLPRIISPSKPLDFEREQVIYQSIPIENSPQLNSYAVKQSSQPIQVGSHIPLQVNQTTQPLQIITSSPIQIQQNKPTQQVIGQVQQIPIQTQQQFQPINAIRSIPQVQTIQRNVIQQPQSNQQQNGVRVNIQNIQNGSINIQPQRVTQLQQNQSPLLISQPPASQQIHSLPPQQSNIIPLRQPINSIPISQPQNPILSRLFSNGNPLPNGIDLNHIPVQLQNQYPHIQEVQGYNNSQQLQRNSFSQQQIQNLPDFCQSLPLQVQNSFPLNEQISFPQSPSRGFALSQGFPHPSFEFNPPQNLNHFNQDFRSYPQGLHSPSQSFHHPSQGFHPPPQEFNLPSQGFIPPPQGFNQPEQFEQFPIRRQEYHQPHEIYDNQHPIILGREAHLARGSFDFPYDRRGRIPTEIGRFGDEFSFAQSQNEFDLEKPQVFLRGPSRQFS